MHGALIAFAVFSMARTQPFKVPEPAPVEVAIISDDDLVRLTKGDRNAKQLDAKSAPPAPDSKAVKEPPKPKVVTPPPPPPPPVEAKVEPPPPPAKEPDPPKPDPIADKLAMLPPDPVPGPDPGEVKRREEEAKRVEEQKRAEDERQRQEAERKKRLDDQKKRAEEQKRLAEAKRKADEARRKAEEAKKKSFDDIMADAIKPALKDNDPRKRPPPPGGTETAMNAPKRGPAAGAPEGRDTQLTASQGAMLGALIKQAVSRCWNINTGAEGIDKIVVRLEVRLRPDGRLAEPPKVRDPQPGALFADTANSAIRAVTLCEPYNFPPDLYKGGWEALIWTFDPRRMF